jgi:hypothetical protein
MKLKTLYLAVLLIGIHLVASSNDCTKTTPCNIADKLHVTHELQHKAAAVPADHTVLGISPVSMLLFEI